MHGQHCTRLGGVAISMNVCLIVSSPFDVVKNLALLLNNTSVMHSVVVTLLLHTDVALFGQPEVHMCG